MSSIPKGHWTQLVIHIIHTRDTLIRNHLAYGNNTLTHCASTIAHLLAPLLLRLPLLLLLRSLLIQSIASTSTASTSLPSIKHAATDCITIGAIAVLLLVLLFLFIRRRSRTQNGRDSTSPFPKMDDRPHACWTAQVIHVVCFPVHKRFYSIIVSETQGTSPSIFPQSGHSPVLPRSSDNPIISGSKEKMFPSD